MTIRLQWVRFSMVNETLIALVWIWKLGDEISKVGAVGVDAELW